MSRSRPYAGPALLVAASGAAGLGRAVFRAADFHAPTRGVRMASGHAGELRRIAEALALVLPDGAAFSHGTAARLWRLPLPDGLEREQLLHVNVPAGGSHPRRAALVTHRARLGAEDLTYLRGLPVTTPLRTWLDLAATLTLPDLVAVGDLMLRRRLCEREQVRARVGAERRRRGIRAARTAADLLDPRPESPQESRLRVHLHVAGLPTGEPIGLILDSDGGFLAWGDLVLREWKIVIEYDGDGHADPARRAADATRRTRLREEGWYVVEITKADLRYPQRAIDKVTRALRVRGAIW